MDKKILKVGIIGGGIIGTNTSPLYNTDKSKVTDVLRRDPEKAKVFGEELNAKFHSAPTFSSKELKSMLKNKFDLTVLAMIPGVQKKVAIECAEQGKPLYVEKMFTRNEQEAQEVVQAFKSKNIPLFVAHFCRCMPQIQYVKQLIDSKSIGNIKNIQMYVKRQYNENALQNKKWMQDPKLSGGGWFTDLGPHYIDALIYLFGDLDVIDSKVEQTFPRYPELEDRVNLKFRTQNGICGIANFDFNADCWGDNVIIQGENGLISFKVLGRDASVIVIDSNGKESITSFKNEKSMQAPMIRQIIDTLYDYTYGKKTLQQIEEEALRKGLCTGQEALKSSKIVSDIILKFQKQIGYSDSRDSTLHRLRLNACSDNIKPFYEIPSSTSQDVLKETHLKEEELDSK